MAPTRSSKSATFLAKSCAKELVVAVRLGMLGFALVLGLALVLTLLLVSVAATVSGATNAGLQGVCTVWLVASGRCVCFAGDAVSTTAVSRPPLNF
mmetsp:Transcript_40039/g.58931  ORF Transcript_40039/g.58931 Transcript_40039/m.58931 type:complete len:96 (+) Transcript_40039:139-426(+)